MGAPFPVEHSMFEERTQHTSSQ